jgi:hypothetical protein
VAEKDKYILAQAITSIKVMDYTAGAQNMSFERQQRAGKHSMVKYLKACFCHKG